ncbi:nif11-like leader peptide domain protein [Synechococcus sp. BIOS-E4-1]|uniref:Nif11-like leader peptide family natural product precursor n=1 Tax=Synechococcus sp. BIOS-E4-1 TaxID=1400864 RepID=UPI00164454C8|nr:Nif11-like leader peptide family natural product precursor [Synechococcus sp. BIOS-E4-1]QNI54909.1 nif11-like leader peptide domain protein [Synechococcus sp. BIOS-E4-1]
MSAEQLKAFLEKVKDNAILQKQIEDAENSETVVSIAKEEGFIISADDLKKIQSEVSDKELEGAAGGCACFKKTEIWFSR